MSAGDGVIAVRSVDKPEYHAHPVAVDILEAFLGAVYRRYFFDLEMLLPIEPVCFSTDDIWFSNHLAEGGIARVKMPYGDESLERAGFGPSDTVEPLRADNVEGVKANEVCARSLVGNFARGWLNEERRCGVAVGLCG